MQRHEAAERHSERDRGQRADKGLGCREEGCNMRLDGWTMSHLDRLWILTWSERIAIATEDLLYTGCTRTRSVV